MSITSKHFGTFEDPESGEKTEVLSYTLSTSKGVIVKIISLGATISSIEVPDKNGHNEYITLGFDSIQGYLSHNYIGSTIGRVGNRIKEGKFQLNGENYQLTINNNNKNHLHGGKQGWDKYVWKSYIEGSTVTFTHYSPDGDQGYPGDVLAQVTYSLDEGGSLKVDFQAMSSRATPINMTNHCFFNLAGHASGQNGLYEHEFQVLGDSYLPVTSDLIPTGVIEPVDKTPFDLRKPQAVADLLAKAPEPGFDHCFYCNKKRGTLELVGVFKHPKSGRKLELFTTEPAVQIYTGNFLPKEEGKMVGRGEVSYTFHGAFCCEPQNFPDAVNQTGFPDAILHPGKIYQHSFVYRFTTE